MLKLINWDARRYVVRRHWFIFITILFYVGLLLSVIRWGIPSSDRVFLYHMDEWHQLMSIRALGEDFTTTVEGAAHGTIFHFLISGAFLGVFQLLGVINIFEIANSVTHLEMQEKIFILLRLSTLIYGAGAIIVLYHILRNQLRLSSYWVGIIFFIFTPTWLSLSNYFKYDIALIFWILLSMLLLFRFIQMPSYSRYILAGIATGLAFDTKLSAAPLFILFVFTYIVAINDWKKNWLLFINGISALLLTVFLLGIPDYLIGKADYSIIIKDVVFDYPANSYNYVFGKHFWLYLIFNQFPVNVGRPLAILFVVSLGVLLPTFFNTVKLLLKSSTLKRIFPTDESIIANQVLITIVGFILFTISLYPLKLFSSGNRMLVIVPFMVIILAYATEKILKNNYFKYSVLGLLYVSMMFQTLESLAWMTVKWQADPRAESSNWIEQHVPTGTEIGITQPLIYEKVPDLILKDYFMDQEETIDYHARYTYKNVLETSSYPDIIILSDLRHEQFKINSPKYQLYKRLLENGYQSVAVFSPELSVQQYVNYPLSFALPNLVPTPLDITILTSPAGKEILL